MYSVSTSALSLLKVKLEVAWEQGYTLSSTLYMLSKLNLLSLLLSKCISHQISALVDWFH